MIQWTVLISCLVKRRLQSQQKKFKTASSTTGESAAQRRANIEKAEQDTQKTIEQNAQSRMELEEKLHFQEEQNNINLERDELAREGLSERALVSVLAVRHGLSDRQIWRILKKSGPVRPDMAACAAARRVSRSSARC